MRIESIELQNFGRHGSLTVDMNAPVSGVLGSNGQGKSTLLCAIKYALTGILDTGRSASEYMKDGGKHGKTFVRLVFSKFGKQGTIVRRITKTTTSRELVWDGREMTAAKEVDATMQDILGTDKRAVSNCVFVPQGKLDEVLFGDAAARELRFLRMVGCGHFDSVSKAATAQAAILRRDTVDMTPALSAVQTQIATAESRWRDLSEVLTQLPDQQANLTKQEQRLAAIARVQHLSAQDQECAVRAGVSWMDLPHAVSGGKLQISNIDRGLAAYAAELEGGNQLINVLQQVLSARFSYWMALKDKEISVARLAELPEARDVEGMRAQYAALNTEFSKLQAEASTQRSIGLLPDRAKALAECEKAALMEQKWRETVATCDKSLEVYNDPHGAFAAAVSQERLLASVCDTEASACPLCRQTLADRRGLAALKAQNEMTLKAMRADRAQLMQVHAGARAELNAAVGMVLFTTNTLTKLDNDRLRLEALLPAAGSTPNIEAVLNATQTQLRELEYQGKAAAEIEQERTRLHTAAQVAYGSFTAAQKALEVANTNALSLRHTVATDTDPEIKSAIDAVKTGSVDKRTEVDRLTQDRSTTQNSVNRLEAAMLQHTNLLNSANTEAAALGTTLDQVMSLDFASREQAELHRLQHIVQSRNSTLAARQEVDKTIANLRAQEKDIDAQLQKNVHSELLASQMDLLAKTFSRSGISSQYLADLFDKLMHVLAPHLRSMEANFEVRKAEGVLNFEFRRVDEDSEWMSQNAMSGGQRVKMAMAFLLALQQVVIPDVGLLVLDEPTTHLDTESREGVRDLLLNMAGVLERTESQVIVCDHCPEILPALRKRVQL